MAVVLAQLAPGGEQALAVVEGERDRPDAALGAVAKDVAIGDPYLALGANRLADRRKLDAVGRGRRPWRREESETLDLVAALLGQHGGDLGERVEGGARQGLVR